MDLSVVSSGIQAIEKLGNELSGEVEWGDYTDCGSICRCGPLRVAVRKGMA